MNGGTRHVLTTLPELVDDADGAKYECAKCGERFQIRHSSPSCPIALLEQIETTIGDRQMNDAMVHQELRRQLRWPKYQRDRFIPEWRRWRQWRADAGGRIPTTQLPREPVAASGPTNRTTRRAAHRRTDTVSEPHARWTDAPILQPASSAPPAQFTYVIVPPRVDPASTSALDTERMRTWSIERHQVGAEFWMRTAAHHLPDEDTTIAVAVHLSEHGPHDAEDLDLHDALPGLACVGILNHAVPKRLPTLREALAAFDQFRGDWRTTFLRASRDLEDTPGVVQLTLLERELTPAAEASVERVAAALRDRGLVITRRRHDARYADLPPTVELWAVRPLRAEGLPEGWWLEPDGSDGWTLQAPRELEEALQLALKYESRFYGADGVSEAVDVAQRIVAGTYTPTIVDAHGTPHGRRSIETAARWVLAHGAQKDQAGSADQQRGLLRDPKVREQLPEHLRAAGVPATRRKAKP